MRDHDVVPEMKDQVPTLALINSELAGRMARQATSSSQVDTKAALLAGLAATATQFLASRGGAHPILSALAFAAYALAFVAAVGAYALARYQDVPEPRELVRLVDRGDAETLANLIATRVGAFESNRSKHRRKVALWWVSVGAFGVGIALSVGAILNNEVL